MSGLPGTTTGRAAPLTATLIAVADLLRDARDDWWIIASAAAALHGVADPTPADVDVLVSVADAGRLRGRMTMTPPVPVPVPAGNGDRHFRSAVFGRWHGAALPVEVMAGFEVRVGARWCPVAPATREAVAVDDAVVWVPARRELIALFRRFGRPKDLVRAAALAALPDG